MPPGESFPRPKPSRQPYPRHRPSVDGLSRRPLPPRPMSVSPQRPIYGRQLPGNSSPPTLAPQPIQPQTQPLRSYNPPQQPTLGQGFNKPKSPLRWPRLLKLSPKRPKTSTLAKVLTPLVVLLIIVGVIRYEADLNNPIKAFNAAMSSSLSTKQVEEDLAANSTSSTVDFDFTSPTDPLVSSMSTVELDGAEFQISGYGSAKNTYISYTALPSVIPGSLSSQVSNDWVQLRSNGTLPPGINSELTNLSDPRYLTIGPVVIGDFASSTRSQLLNYIQTNHIYSYQADQVTSTTLSGQSVFVYKVKLNQDYLQTLNQSAAVIAGFSPTDIQAAVNNLEGIGSSNVVFYIAKDSRHLVEVTISSGGKTQTISYGKYNDVNLPGEPETQLSWQEFAAEQMQIEADASAHQSAAARDSLLKANLAAIHSALAQYYTQNNDYPTFGDLSDQAWIASNLSGLNPDVFRDPSGTTLSPVNTPAATLIAYQPVTASGKSPCDNNVNICAHYKLVGLLSNNQPYTVTDP